jgi:predicted nucleic acid-binding protein
MIVVADTSPLNYLIQIECEAILSVLYKDVLVPKLVLAELCHPEAPAAIHKWLLDIPRWIEVRQTISLPDSNLAFLGPGEREAIQLAQEQHADLLLIDERKGRAEARRRGLATTGTLGVLLAAGERGLVDPAASYQRLSSETTFRVTPELQEVFLQRVREFRKKT